MTELDFDPEFKEMPMWDQLGKIMDSAGNPIERNWVVTDEGVKIDGVSPQEAKTIIDIVADVPSPIRLDLLKYIQTTEGFYETLCHVRNT